MVLAKQLRILLILHHLFQRLKFCFTSSNKGVCKKGLLITISLKKHHISNSFVRKLFIFPSPLRIKGMTEEKIHVWKVLIWILSKKCKISNNILMLWISESIKHTCSNHSWVILPCHKPSGTACQRARWTFVHYSTKWCQK